MEDVTVNVLGIILGAIILGGFFILIFKITVSHFLLARTEKGLTSLISTEATAEEIADFCWRNRIGFSGEKFYKFYSFFDPKTLGIAYGAILKHRKYCNGRLMFKYGNLSFLARELLLLNGKSKSRESFLSGMASQYPEEAEQPEKELGRILREEASEQVLQEA